MMTVSTQSRFFWLCLFLIVVGCGPSGQAVEETLMVEVAQAVPGTVAAIASATPLPTLTPQSTFTPHATYTPLPTLTLAPTLSPRPTYTPFPTLTPLPTATAIPSATSTLTRRPITPTPAVNLKETLLLEVNRRIFYYESYNGTFYARCDLFGCDYSLACDQVVYFYDLLSAPYTVDVSQADPAIQVAHQKLQTAIAQAATGYGWANTCRTALASGTGVTTQNASQGEPNVPVEVISLLREAQTILASQP